MIDPFADIADQDLALDILRRALAEERVASAYLFEGPSGVGKELAARALAAHVIASREDGSRDAQLQSRVERGHHPDCRVFRPRDEGRRNLKVEFVRSEILPFAEFAPFEARDAFLIFPEADVSFPDLHPESANALLKTLEEPKPGVHFVLLSERPERLLDTIRSRAQRVPFGRLRSSTLAGILDRHELDEAGREAAIALADGQADRALHLADEGRAQELLDLALEVDGAAHGKKPGALVRAAEALAKREDLALALDTLLRLYRDFAVLAAGLDAERLSFAHAAELIRPRGETLGAAVAAERCALILEAQRQLEGNGNKQVVCDALLYRLRDARP